MLANKALKKLLEREKDKTLRSLITCEDYLIDFASNDYLGLAKIAKDEDLLSENYGSGGSRLISGNYKEINELEKYIAEFYGYQSSLFFGSGTLANIGLIGSIAQENDLILYDELCHASIRDGMRLSFAKRKKFTHQDLKTIKKIAEAEDYEDLYIITESLFSMDGDKTDFDELAEIATELDAFVIVDDSHAAGLDEFSILNPNSKHKIHNNLLACMIGFGKGLGAQGGVVLGGKDLKNFLINFARTFVYSTAPGIAQIRLVENQHKKLEKLGVVQRKKLTENINFFRNAVKNLSGFAGYPNSPIQTYFAETDELIEKQKKLKENKIFCKAILAPTVAKGSERFRINLHSYNTKEEIDLLIDSIKT